MTAAVALAVAVAIILVFDFTNGFHDSANSVAALVATRAATPGAALLPAAVCHVAGPLLAGTTVADTVGGVVRLPAAEVVPAVGAAVTAGIAWNLLTWWRGLPSSSSHALVGGLAGACFVAAGRESGGVASTASTSPAFSECWWVSPCPRCWAPGWARPPTASPGGPCAAAAAGWTSCSGAPNG